MNLVERLYYTARNTTAYSKLFVKAADEITRLQAENKRMEAEADPEALFISFLRGQAASMKQLAAAQLENSKLREALTCSRALIDTPISRRKLNIAPDNEFLTCIREALSTPTNTDALTAYVAETLERIAEEAPINGNSIAQVRVLLAAQQLRNMKEDTE